MLALLCSTVKFARSDLVKDKDAASYNPRMIGIDFCKHLLAIHI